MFRALVLATVIAATLGGSAMAQPPPWHRHHMWRHSMMMRRCHWVWHRSHRARVCWRR